MIIEQGILKLDLSNQYLIKQLLAFKALKTLFTSTKILSAIVSSFIITHASLEPFQSCG